LYQAVAVSSIVQKNFIFATKPEAKSGPEKSKIEMVFLLTDIFRDYWESSPQVLNQGKPINYEVESPRRGRNRRV